MNYLVMDDERLAREYMKEMLEEASPGNCIYDTDNPQEALGLMDTVDVDILFLDIEMPNINGIEFAKQVKIKKNKINIVFCTGYDQYTKDAFDVDASAYLLKPVSVDQIKHALDNLRYGFDSASPSSKRIFFQCFGNFECFIDGEPVLFKFSKTRELLAYLVHRNGALSTVHELESVLWEDEEHASYLRKLKKDLLDNLRELHAENLIVSARGYLGIRMLPDIYCDYYSWLKGEPSGINAYKGEYMSQYPWADYTNAMLSNESGGAYYEE